MSLSKFTKDIAYIEKQPNVVKDQATALKQTFDKAGLDIQEYINDVLTEELDTNISTLDSENVKLTGDQTIDDTKTFLKNIVADTAPTLDDHLTNKLYVDTLDNQNVKLTGNQTIAGEKEFTANVKSSPVPTENDHLSNKQYVDGLHAQTVKLTGNQSIDGVKTFTSAPKSIAPSNNDDVANKKYVDDGLALKTDLTYTNTQLALKADKTNVLQKDNTTIYDPVTDYHPATVKYVNDQIAEAQFGEGGVYDGLDSYSTEQALSANQGRILNNNNLDLAGTGRTTETVKANADNITQLSTDKMDKSSIVANLTTNSDTAPLAASQGKILNDKITALDIDGIDGVASTHTIFTNAIDKMEATTEFLPSGNITVDYKQDSSPILFQLIEFNPDGSITETFEFTDRTGTKETIFNPDGSITETYNEVIL